MGNKRMQSYIAACAALALVFLMATLAVFLVLVETADATTLDPYLAALHTAAPILPSD